jgi:hypothetical protein
LRAGLAGVELFAQIGKLVVAAGPDALPHDPCPTG